MLKRGGFVLAALGASLLGTSVGAQEEGVRLSLDDTLRMALKNNLDLVSARKDPEVSFELVNGQLAVFDPNLNTTFSASGFETEPSEEFQSAGIRKDYAARSSYLQDFEWGGDVDVALTSSRSSGAGTPFFGTDPFTGDAVDEPFYQSTLDLTYNQRLLRGRGRVNTTERLELARGDLEISREELRRQAELTLETVEGAYWDVLAAYRALDVERQALERANDLLDLNRKKVEVGTLAPIEITQAEAGVASQQEGVILAEVTLENVTDELRRLLAVPWGDPLWAQPLHPSDGPQFDPQPIDLEAALAQGLESRPEIHNARKEVLKDELSERVAKNGLKHGLDLSVRFSPEGNSILLGEADPVGGIADTYSELGEGDFFSWQGAVTYSVPIRNRAAKSSYRIATLTREKSEIDLDNRIQTVRVEVRRAFRGVDSGVERVTAAKTNVRLQREKLEAEQKKFENGMSTSFEVLTFQNDLADAELGEIRAVLDYMKALAALERAKGTLLAARGLALAP